MEFKEYLNKELSEGANLEPGAKVSADKLVKGKHYFAFYKNGGHSRTDFFKFLVYQMLNKHMANQAQFLLI